MYTYIVIRIGCMIMIISFNRYIYELVYFRVQLVYFICRDGTHK